MVNTGKLFVFLALIVAIHAQGPQKSCCNGAPGTDFFLQSPADTVQECHANLDRDGVHTGVEYHGWAWDLNPCHLVAADCDEGGAGTFCLGSTGTVIDGGGTNNIVGFPDDVSATTAGCGTESNAVTITRTWTSTSLCGTQPLTLDQTITLSDTEPPVLRIAPDFTMECELTEPDPTEFLGFSVFDMCTPPEMTIETGPVIISADTCSASFTITYTANDFCNTPVSALHTITVEDTSPPVFDNSGSGYSDRAFTCANQLVDDYDVAPDGILSDLCFFGGLDTVSLASQVVIPGSCDNQFTVEKTYIAQDQCGNSAEHVAYVYVEDFLPPIITSSAFPPTVVPCSFAPLFFTATDNCGGAVDLVVETVDGDNNSAYLGVSTAKVTATDSCGNSAVEFFTFADVEYLPADPVSTPQTLASKGVAFSISYSLFSTCNDSTYIIDVGPGILQAPDPLCVQASEGGLIYCSIAAGFSGPLSILVTVPITYQPHTLMVTGNFDVGFPFSSTNFVTFDN